METAQGQLLDALEIAVEEAFEKESDKWLEDAENDGMQVELYASSGAVAIKYGVGVEEHALKTPKKTQHPKVCADEFSKVLEVMDSTVKQQQADEETTDDAAAHSGDAGGGIDAADVVLDENADEDEMQEHDGDAADEKVEVLWGGRLETINVSQLEIGDIIFVAAGWVPPATCRVLACITEQDKSWPVPSWIDNTIEEEDGYWSYASTRGMDTIQADASGRARVLSWEACPKPSTEASQKKMSLKDSPNIAVGGLPMISGAFLGVVINKRTLARKRSSPRSDANAAQVFPAEYKLDVCQKLVTTLEVQGIARFAPNTSDSSGNHAELALARLHASLLGVMTNGSYMQINGGSDARGEGAEVAECADNGVITNGSSRGRKTIAVLCCCSPVDPEEISCLCKLLAEVDILTILLLAPGVRAAFIDDHSTGSDEGITMHIGKTADVGAVVRLAHSIVVKETTKPICVTIDDQLIVNLVDALQGTRADPAGDRHPLQTHTEYRVLYVGGLLCRAYPGVHNDIEKEDGLGAAGQNSVSCAEFRAMESAYFSIALAGATDLCRSSADLTVTANDEDDTYYEYYDKISPVLYILDTILELGSEFYANGGHRKVGCFPCLS